MKKQTAINMTKREKAKEILKSIDATAPTVIDWNNEELWIDAIARGLTEIEKRGDVSER